MSELVLTDEEQQKVDEGDAARALLDAPMFLTAIERLRHDASEKILSSAPDEIGKREEAYNLSRALSEVTRELLIVAAEGERIAATAQTITDEEQQPSFFSSGDY